jgi:hypothetical protein
MTEVPAWLELLWDRMPYAPQHDTLEERAEDLIAKYMEAPPKVPPNFLKVFAWDLVCACPQLACPTPPDVFANPPTAVERLMLLALGLPPKHRAGSWNYFKRPRATKSGAKRPSRRASQDIYDGRGRWDEHAMSAARRLEWTFAKKRLTLTRLETMMRAYGFKTSRSTLRKWRRNGDLL